MKSIMQKERYDYLIGYDPDIDWDGAYLEEHHCFFGKPGRKNAEKYGLKVWLTLEHHKGGNGPHQNRDTDLWLKRQAQAAFERAHGSREEFMRIFGRNYLETD